MPNSKGPGPNPQAIRDWITTTYPETVVAEAMGATFFSLDDKHWPNFATIVDHGRARHGHAIGPGSGRRVPAERRRWEGDVRASGRPDAGRRVDYAALDRVIPHPVYAKQRWLAILNPSHETFEEVVQPLIAEAHERLARPRSRAGV